MVCLFLPGMDLLSYRIGDALLSWRTFVKAAHGMNLIINVLIRRHGNLWTWRAAGSLGGMSSRWSMTGSCAPPCWVLHSHEAPEWLQEKIKSKKIGKGGKVKPPAQGSGKRKGPHKGGKSPPSEGYGSTLHPLEDCWTLHPELREKAKAEGRLSKRHSWKGHWQRSKSKRTDQAGRDMGPSPATVCPAMWVNQAQAWDDGYCTRLVIKISGAKEEIPPVPRPGHAEKVPKGVIFPGIYISHKGTSE